MLPSSTPLATMPRRYTRFADFYPFYLGEHRHPVCRALHFIGTSLGAALLAWGLLVGPWWWVAVGLVQGYAWAWVGHFGFEKNRPASFRQPLYSFMGDWVMWAQLLTGRLPFRADR